MTGNIHDPTTYTANHRVSPIYTSTKIIKNEVGCKDDTVPKTGDTRRHCEVELTACNNLPQPLRKIVACCQLYLAVPSCVTCFWDSIIPTSYFIFNDFCTCLTNFFCTAQGHVACLHTKCTQNGVSHSQKRWLRLYIASPSDSYDESLRNKGSNVIEN